MYRTAMPGSREVTPEDKKSALEGVLQTASFLRAEQLRNFLRFICEMEMAGRAGEITEYLIGVEALGRPAGYSTAEDSIVRRRAIDLREKLEEVYTGELAAARVRIELPKGRYVPHFVLAPAVPNGAAAVPMPPVAAAARASTWRTFAVGFVAGALAAAAAFVMAQRLHAPPRREPEPGVVYEGESPDNVLHGATTIGSCPSCSGGARVRNIGNSSDNYVVVHGVTVAAEGSYAVRIDYFLQGQRSFYVSVNDGPPVELRVRGEGWNTPASASLTVPLKAGTNSLRFGNEHAYAPDLDRVVVR
jgi:hypothetical protein